MSPATRARVGRSKLGVDEALTLRKEVTVMDLTWIGIAFVFGLAVKRLGQAPLLGFLAAGFLMKKLGLEADPSLTTLSNIGVQLLLFAIGLKLDLRSLLRPHVLGASLLHTVLVTLLSAGALAVPMALGAGPFANVTTSGIIAIAFIGCFSSTLFSVKILEERDNMNALYGRVLIGILVVQDLVAVAFLAVTKGTVPSPWALLLLGLPLLRPVIGRLLAWAGHRELLVLAGLALTLGGAKLFGLVGIKEDLGPLVAGAIVGGMPKAKELSASLLSIKDLLLVGFFVTIGLTGAPNFADLAVAVGLALLLPLKFLLYMVLFTRFGLRGRSAWLASLGLTPYSEFGLIVGSVAVTKGWLDPSWMVTLALAMGVSFVPLSLINRRALELYAAHRSRFTRLERKTPIAEEQPVRVGPARVLVFGLGEVGAYAYERARALVGDRDLVGFDVDEKVVNAMASEGRRVFEASATDADFWARLELEPDRVELVMLSTSSHEENMAAVTQLRNAGYDGTIAATARYDDEVDELRAQGVEVAFNKLVGAGPAFAAAALAQTTINTPADTKNN